MISVQEAKKIIRQNLPQRRIESVKLPDASGKILAENIFAAEPSPRYTNSAMDGFAVRWEDVQAVESAPVNLSVVGACQAGVPYEAEVSAGQAVETCTGAMLPAGTDTVVPVEDVETDGNTVTILNIRQPYQHVRCKGEEFEAGQLLLTQGRQLNPVRIALLASQGIAVVRVYQPARVSIISTGTELIPFDVPETPEPSQIRDSSSLAVAAAVKKSGGLVSLVTRVVDEMQPTRAVLQKAMEQSDIILFCGGVSVGPHDLVKPAAQALEFETLFWKVRQKPGKPLFFAKKEHKLLFGLPGNPVAAVMCYLYYVHPVIESLRDPNFHWIKKAGKLTQEVINKKAKPEFLRVAFELTSDEIQDVRPLKRQNSYMLTSLTEASGFIFLDAHVTMRAGEQVEVMLFPWED